MSVLFLVIGLLCFANDAYGAAVVWLVLAYLTRSKR